MASDELVVVIVRVVNVLVECVEVVGCWELGDGRSESRKEKSYYLYNSLLPFGYFLNNNHIFSTINKGKIL